MAILLAIAALPAFKAADTPPNPRGDRVSTLDGLRGFLALAVFFHHAAIYHAYLLNGSWNPPPSRFYAMLGPCGVSLFFMITGYLFWARMLKTGGKPNWIQLYTGRVFRIGPLYLFAVAIMLAIVFSKTGPHLQVPATQLIKELARWGMLGYSNPDVNGYAETWTITARVTWSLRFEWQFYASLLVTAFVARFRGADLRFTIVGLLACLGVNVRYGALDEVGLRSACAALFFAGMTCASLARRGFLWKVDDRLASVIVLVLLTITTTQFDLPYRAGPILLLAVVFFLITSGCTVFGLLSSRPARRLGDISYGIYLLQGLVLFLVFSLPQARALALSSPEMHWALMLLCAALLIVIATITHVWIERTGIDLGKRVSAALGAGA